jgi:pimeloyl-ACP methyl ester carboxylesterase
MTGDKRTVGDSTQEASMASLTRGRINEEEWRVGATIIRRTYPPRAISWKSPVLMVHGAYHDWWAFDRWRELFASAGWTVDSLSLRQTTAKEGGEPSLFDFAETVSDVARTYGSPPIIVGHSMGGLLAQKAAESIDCRAVVAVASVGPGQLGAHDPENGVVDYREEYSAELDERYIDPPTHAAVHDRLVVESALALRMLRTGQMSVDAARVRCPLLAIGARQDQTRVHSADAIAAVYSGDVLWFEEARHDLMLESKWFEVGIATIEWLIIRGKESRWTS